MRRTNGHTSATADTFTEAKWTAGPLAITEAAGFVYTLLSVLGLVFLAMIWTHYAERGK
ncbi:hypothetical protein LCGC14_0511130 [marine sediment metagenome]|uniref:Uncharacterized protein n=1 Tax=marine sediment metagenome TaxID=412755 RepID=A0A0F9SJJ8_9ZZZZ